mmetsp:Transcript_9703/g.21295  ORF Transcript_9703/g.21295 Transcript_9703/m.21295 type:complete len:482 (-) Transcript_9703:465-1910(-)
MLMPAQVILSVSSPAYFNTSSLTRLKFHAADPSGARGRRLAPHKARRQLSSDGWRLQGNLHTLGYFSAEVCVGSPQRKFDLIVDTGSALTAFPCEECSHCGAHKHASVPGMRFSVKGSASAKSVTCSSPPVGMHSCRSCDAGQCGYAVSYTEGSSIRGHLVYDNFWFASSTGLRAGVHASFGCQTYESGLFYSQVADGITGFSQANSYGPTLFDYLKMHTKCPDVFSMCLSEEVGALVLGGSVPTTLKTDWIPYTGSSSYIVDMIDLTIAGKSVGAPSSSYSSTIIDSGTTFMYLPPAAYRAVRDHWRNTCPWGSCASRTAKGEYPDDYCYTMNHNELERFTWHHLVFRNGVRVPFGPMKYAYELRTGVWCLGVFDNDHNGAVIGGANMRNSEVIFDRENRRVSFVQANCKGMYDGTAPSALTGGYGLSGCTALDPQKVPPPPPHATPPPPSPLPPPKSTSAPPSLYPISSNYTKKQLILP